MKIAIVGLPYSGKTTLFGAITGAHGMAAGQAASAQLATVTVPDDRLDAIAKTISPEKITYAHVDFVDMPGVAADMERERVADVLAASREADGIVHVIRHFNSPSAPPHPHGSLDPKRDIAELEADLIVADLDVVERRIVRVEKQIAKHAATMEKDKKEFSALQRLKEALESGRRASAVEFSTEERELLKEMQFLTTKPILNVLNVAEGELSADGGTRSVASDALGPDAVVICAQVEKEIAELKPEERAEFLEGLGIGEPAARKIIRACYHAVGQRSFFTADKPEARAWTIQAGDTALIAAGKIHSDLARGFIRAEVTAYEDFAKYGSIKEAKNQGKMRLEGKDYVVQDGDILLIRFKV
jgi:GTP-binding protein YchF